jgi:hypothetical protein
LRVLYHHRIRGIDGQAVHVRALLQALVAEGHEVREVALVRVFGPAADATAGRDQGAHSSEHRNRPLKWIDRLPRPMLELAEALYSLIAPPMIARAATRFHPDFIYERYAFGNVGGVLAGRRLGIPLVLEVNAPLADELARTHGVFFAALARRLEALALRRADLICVVSEVLRGIVLAGGARQGRVLVVPNGVDTAGTSASPSRRTAGRWSSGSPASFESGTDSISSSRASPARSSRVLASSSSARARIHRRSPGVRPSWASRTACFSSVRAPTRRCPVCWPPWISPSFRGSRATRRR